MILSQCFLSLRCIYNSWTQSNPVVQFPSIPSPTSINLKKSANNNPTEGNRLMTEKINLYKKNISDNFNSWCQQLSEQIVIVSKFLEETSVKCSQNSSKEWETVKKEKFNTIENCKNYLSEENGKNNKLDFFNFFFSLLITEVPGLWNSLFGRLFICVQSIMQCCNNAYKESLDILMQKNENTDRVVSLVKILQGSTERFLKENITQLNWTIEEKNVKDTVFYWCKKFLDERIFAFSPKIDSLFQFHQLIESNISALPSELSKIIVQEFFKMTEKVVSHLRKIETQIIRDIEKCNSLVEINSENMSSFHTQNNPSSLKINSPSLFNFSNENNNNILLSKIFSKFEWKNFKGQNVESLIRNSFKQFNLFSITIHSDQDSQFRALSHQVYNTEEAYGLVKIIVLNEILANPQRYSKFLQKNQPNNQNHFIFFENNNNNNFQQNQNNNNNDHNDNDSIYDNFEEIQQLVSKYNNGTEIGNVITLLAFINVYQCFLYIYSPFSSSSPLVLKPVSTNQNSTKNYHISLVGHNFYQSLIPFENLNVEDVLLDPKFVNKTERRKRKYTKKTRSNSNNNLNFIYKENSQPITIESNETVSPTKNNTKKRNFSVEVQLEVDRIEKKIKSEKVFLKTRKVQTLKNMCIDIVSQYCSLMPSLEGCLPNELLQKIISLLIVKKTLDAKNFSKFLSSSMNSLDLSNSDQLDDSYCQIISKRCSNLVFISLENCRNVTNTGFYFIFIFVFILFLFYFYFIFILFLFYFILFLFLYIKFFSIGIQYLVSSPSSLHLKAINLSGCVQVGDLGLQEIAKKCGELININLEGCKKITDCSMQNLFLSCKKLSFCNVSGCQELTDEAFKFVGNSFQVFNLFGCSKIGDLALSYILKNNHENIQKLKISGNKISPSSMELISSCSKLVSLEVHDSFLPENSYNQLWKLPLQRLALPSVKNLKENSFQMLFNQEIENLSNFIQSPSISMFGSQLVELDLSSSLTLNDNSLRIISSKCQNIKSLYLKSCEELSDVGVALLSNLGNLECLDLSNLKITDDSISSIALHCLKLAKLLLCNCRNVTDHSMKYLADNLLGLKQLDLCFCHKVTDQGFSLIASHCKELEVIGLEDLIVSDNSVTLLASCPNLRVLNFAYCKMISDYSLYKLAESCLNIEVIDLSYCAGITISAVQSAISKWENLYSLSVRGNDLLTSQAISHPRLRNLDISWCKYLTDDALILSSRNCPVLSSLDLTWCIKLTDKSVKNISTICPSLREIKLRGCTSVSFSAIKYLINIGTICHR